MATTDITADMWKCLKFLYNVESARRSPTDITRTNGDIAAFDTGLSELDILLEFAIFSFIFRNDLITSMVFSYLSFI